MPKGVATSPATPSNLGGINVFYSNPTQYTQCHAVQTFYSQTDSECGRSTWCTVIYYVVFNRRFGPDSCQVSAIRS